MLVVSLILIHDVELLLFSSLLQQDTFFLSAEECVTAAHLQNLHPNICRLSPDGCFGSKFTTVVVTGDASNHIHFEAYQVSNQAMALVKDNILVPTYDAPELGYVKETTKEQFVPEVFYAVCVFRLILFSPNEKETTLTLSTGAYVIFLIISCYLKGKIPGFKS